MKPRARIFLAAAGVVLTLTAYASVAIPVVSPAQPAAALPPPPYSRFAGQTFEPSAAAFDPASGRVLVLSDKDTTLYRYELGPNGLVLPSGERHHPLRLPVGLSVAKFEGLTRLALRRIPGRDGVRPSVTRATTGCSGSPMRPALPPMPCPSRSTTTRSQQRFAAFRGLPWFKIEALAVDRTGTKLLFGVRCVGQSWAAPRDVVLVVRCPLERRRVGAPEAVIRLSTANALNGLTEGLSDLQLDADGASFLLLTSHEGTLPTREAHSGHLFQVPAAVLLGPAAETEVPLGAPLRGFRAKPEGLAVEPSGALVVVFDDDRDWKHLFAGYEQSDGLFTVIQPG